MANLKTADNELSSYKRDMTSSLMLGPSSSIYYLAYQTYYDGSASKKENGIGSYTGIVFLEDKKTVRITAWGYGWYYNRGSYSEALALAAGFCIYIKVTFKGLT